MNRSITESLRFEALEPKQMMAGDVMIGASGGNLFLTGDAADNQIAITSAGRPNAVAIVGLADTFVVMGGQIHAPGQPAIVPRVFGNVVVDLNGGNDTVVVKNVALHHDLAIYTRAGDDSVVVGPLAEAPSHAGVSVGGTLMVNAGSGDDIVVLSRVRVAMGLVVDAGAGDDTIAVGGSRIHGFAVLLGREGHDRIAVQQTIVGHFMVVDGGRGAANDNVVIDQTRAPRARIAMGAGDDGVQITNSAFHEIGVDLGAGRDRLALGSVSVSGAAVFGGGIGDDLLLLLGENQIAHGRIGGFEAVIRLPLA